MASDHGTRLAFLAEKWPGENWTGGATTATHSWMLPQKSKGTTACSHHATSIQHLLTMCDSDGVEPFTIVIFNNHSECTMRTTHLFPPQFTH